MSFNVEIIVPFQETRDSSFDILSRVNILENERERFLDLHDLGDRESCTEKLESLWQDVLNECASLRDFNTMMWSLVKHKRNDYLKFCERKQREISHVVFHYDEALCDYRDLKNERKYGDLYEDYAELNEGDVVAAILPQQKLQPPEFRQAKQTLNYYLSFFQTNPKTWRRYTIS